MQDRIKDRLMLVVVGILGAVGAALFWRWAGDRGWQILMLISWLGAVLENVRLRKRLKALHDEKAKSA